MKMEFLDVTGNAKYPNASPKYLVRLSEFSDNEQKDLIQRIEQFLENEDITHLYILSQSSSANLLATNLIPVDFNSFEKIVLFIKTNLTSKLTRENLGLFSSFKTKSER